MKLRSMFHSPPRHNVMITKAGIQIGGAAPNYEGRLGRDPLSVFIPASIIVERGIKVERHDPGGSRVTVTFYADDIELDEWAEERATVEDGQTATDR